MTRLALLAALAVLATSAYAQDPSCKAQAGEKKLAGAAFNSFMKKCETDAKKACERFVKTIPGYKRDDYVKTYFAGEE